MKVCNSCNIQLCLTDFYSAKHGKYGVRASCKTCEGKKQVSRRASPDIKDKISDYNKNYPRDKKLKASKAWVNANYTRVLSYNASRRQISKKATLKGYQKEIEEFYWLARDLKLVTGEDYHVDHIVPLRGKDVCGLHVPWNLQILPSDLNLSKGNSFDATKEEF